MVQYRYMESIQKIHLNGKNRKKKKIPKLRNNITNMSGHPKIKGANLNNFDHFSLHIHHIKQGVNFHKISQ